MCGFAGIITDELTTSEVSDALRRMNDSLAHRGPDDSGHAILPFGGGRVGLCHERLSILDLTAAGHQPMVHAESGGQIVFNGEIYNFRRLRSLLEKSGESFKSNSDTEVLLAGLVRYGFSFLEQLEGMFALAYYNPRSHSLLLARDSQGIKPLYWTETSGAILFASETRAFIASGMVTRSIDRRGLASALAYGGVQQPLTVFSEVQSLPPGAYIEFAADDAQGWRKNGPYRFWDYPAANAISSNAAVASIHEAVHAAVRDHLVADVPVGIFLSSGIDSTILAGVAREYSPQVNCLTVAFDGSPNVSEGDMAEQTAKRFGLPHKMVHIADEEAWQAVSEWLNAIDQPSMDGLNVFLISRAMREHGIKVALSGLGADELFGGYPSFLDCPRLYRMRKSIGWLPSGVRRMLRLGISLGKTASYRSKLADILSGNSSVASICLGRRRLLSNRQMQRLGFDSRDLELSKDFQPQEAIERFPVDEDPLRTVSILESQFYESNVLLRDADNMGMAFGLEIRVPYLDKRLIETVYSLPSTTLFPKGAIPKSLLRSAFPELLGTNHSQPKLGFTLPIGRWLQGPLRSWCHDRTEFLKNLLPPDGIDCVVREFEREPNSPLWSRLFMLAVVGDFMARHFSGIQLPGIPSQQVNGSARAFKDALRVRAPKAESLPCQASSRCTLPH